MGIGKINKVKVDLRSYPPYIFLAEPKFGKTGFWNDLVIKAWGDAEKGLLFAFEKGYLSYDGMQVYDCDDWAMFVEGVDYIVEHPDEYSGVCIDTLDTMIDKATKEVLRLHRKEIGSPCKSLLDAFKGYGRGKQRLLDICNEQIERLRNAGVAVFFLAHTKKKSLTDLLTGVEYDQITNNLTSDIYNNFANNAQMIMVGVKDREVVDGKLINEGRTVYLRGNSFVDAGSRFETLPDTINGDREFLVDQFLDAFTNAVKASIKSGSSDDKAIAKAKKEEESERKSKAAEAQKAEKEAEEDNSELKSELISELSALFTKADDDKKKVAKSQLIDAGFKKFNDDGVTVELLQNIIEGLKG